LVGDERGRYRLAWHATQDEFLLLAWWSVRLSCRLREGISPIDQLAAAQGAIQKAEQAGAEHEPQASST